MFIIVIDVKGNLEVILNIKEEQDFAQNVMLSCIKDMKNKEFMKCYKLIIIFLLIGNVIFPIWFIWVVEISMEFNDDIILTNGFFTATPIKVYHFIAWLMIFTSIFSSLYALYYLDKVFKK